MHTAVPVALFLCLIVAYASAYPSEHSSNQDDVEPKTLIDDNQESLVGEESRHRGGGGGYGHGGHGGFGGGHGGGHGGGYGHGGRGGHGGHYGK